MNMHVIICVAIPLISNIEKRCDSS